MSYIGLDIGTSGCKASIITKEALVLTTAHSEYALKFPQKEFVELNPEEIFNAVKKVLKEISPMAGDVRALAISSFGEAFVLLDENRKPLYNFITYADGRCKSIGAIIEEHISTERLFEITAVMPNQTFSLYKLIWFMKNKPEIIKQARYIFFANDYFNYLLTNKRGIDYGTASKTLLFDAHCYNWSEEILSTFSIPQEWFSPILEVGSEIGVVQAELAEELGLPDNITVYLGCHDQCSATLGAGVYEPGNIVIGEGSTESINAVVDKSIFLHARELQKGKMCLEPFIFKDRYIVPVSFLTYGNAVRWYIRTLEQSMQAHMEIENNIYTLLEEKCADRTDLIFLPYLSSANTSNPDSKAPGAFLGITLDTNQNEFYLAVLQGLNFESKINFNRLLKLGLPIDYVSATGGMTKSSMFMQMKADILNQEVHVLNNSEAGIVGLAIICAIACGDYSDYKEAIKKFVSVKKTYKPEKDYSEQFINYVRMSEILQ